MTDNKPFTLQDFERLHTCDKCQSVFNQQRTAYYRRKGILIPYVYYCLDHAAIADDISGLQFEYNENGFTIE